MTTTYRFGKRAIALPFHASTGGTSQGSALPTGSDLLGGSRPATGTRLRGLGDTEPTFAPDSVVRGSVI